MVPAGGCKHQLLRQSVRRGDLGEHSSSKKDTKGKNKIFNLKLVTSSVAFGASWWQRAVSSLRQSVSLSDGETLGLDCSSNIFKSFYPDCLLLKMLRKNFSVKVELRNCQAAATIIALNNIFWYFKVIKWQLSLYTCISLPFQDSQTDNH